MQFTPYRILQILRQEKTQTRRSVHEGDTPHNAMLPAYDSGVYAIEKVCRANGSVRYKVGKTCCLQPGRGKRAIWYSPQTLATDEAWLQDCKDNGMDISIWGDAASSLAGFIPARIKILEICKQDVLNISLEDAHAEGFQTCDDFWEAWILMYDRVGRRKIVRNEPRPNIVTMIQQVPIVLRMAWVLRFELVIK